MKGYYDSQATFSDGLVVTDKAVADYTVKHMHPEDQADSDIHLLHWSSLRKTADQRWMPLRR